MRPLPRTTACMLLATLAACGTEAPADLVVEGLGGESVRPFQDRGSQAEVLLFVAPDCPISNALAPEVRRITEEYAARGVDFHLVYADGSATREEIAAHVDDFGYTVPVLLDFEHRLVEYTGATVTPEAAVLTPAGELLYLGRINDLYTDFGQRRAEPTTSELRDALDAVLAGREPATDRVEAIGCFIPD